MRRPSTLSRLQFAVPSLQSPLATLADLRRAGYPRPLAVPSSARNLAKATTTNAGYNGGDMDKRHSPLKPSGADLDKALSLQASSEKGPLPSGSRENGPSPVVFGVGILRSGICGIGRKARSIKVDDPEGAPRPLLAKRFRTGTGKAFATYWGPSLTQGHETVLMHLAERMAGYLPGQVLGFDAREFVRSMPEWSDSVYSRKRLWANLRDWRGAVLQTSHRTASEWKDVPETILGSLERSFYGDSEGERLESERSERFSVKVSFSEGGMEVFRGVPVEVSLKKRAKLAEGLESWMYGIIRSSYSGAGFSYQYLFELSGLGDSWAAGKAVRREFARDVRKALTKMVTPGTKVIWDWSPEGAGVRVWKNKPTEKQVASMLEWQPRRALAQRK
jgi:hypothetical protein